MKRHMPGWARYGVCPPRARRSREMDLSYRARGGEPPPRTARKPPRARRTSREAMPHCQELGPCFAELTEEVTDVCRGCHRAISTAQASASDCWRTRIGGCGRDRRQSDAQLQHRVVKLGVRLVVDGRSGLAPARMYADRVTPMTGRRGPTEPRDARPSSLLRRLWQALPGGVDPPGADRLLPYRGPVVGPELRLDLGHRPAQRSQRQAGCQCQDADRDRDTCGDLPGQPGSVTEPPTMTQNPTRIQPSR